MKRKVEYQIVKRLTDYPPHYWDFWDGPYKTLAAAKKVWEKSYKLEGVDQDFLIAKVTYELAYPRRQHANDQQRHAHKSGSHPGHGRPQHAVRRS